MTDRTVTHRILRAPGGTANGQRPAGRLSGTWLGGCAAVLVAACAPMPTAPVPPQVVSAWVQQAAPSGWQVRAITTAPNCPALRWPGAAQPMTERVGPTTVPVRADAAQPQTQPSVFAVRTCEAPVPPGVVRMQVDRFELAAPASELRRLVLIADTGCRLKRTEDAFQDCNDAARWPFAEVARQATARHPDLVVHVGDIHYRESPCPQDRPGCAGSPWSYGHDAWAADLFDPAAPLLAAAPWVFVRGNHESCNRAGVGWFRYLDAEPWSPEHSCVDPRLDDQADFSAPFAVSLDDDTQLIVFDTSRVSNRAYAPDAPAFARYSAQLLRVAELASHKPHNIFLSHHPALAFAGSASGKPKPGTAGRQSGMQSGYPGRVYAPGVDLVVNGHFHLFEALDFSSGQPAELLVGNGGSDMEGTVDPVRARAAEPAPGALVRTFETQPGFGFATLERLGAGWHLTEWTSQGRPVLQCDLRGSQWRCDGAA